MAVWFLLRAGIVLALLLEITYCEHDLLENLHVKRDDPPELTEFLESVLQKKDEFKKIREAANHLQLHTSSIDENSFLTNNQDDSHDDTANFLSSLQDTNKDFKRNIFSRSNNHRHLKRHSGNSDRPINDVYPYLYDGNEHENELESDDEREERSPWKDVREKKHRYGKHQRWKRRYRRGLDLNDYSSDNDFDLSNVKVLPRSKFGVRTVPGIKYEQKRGISVNVNHRTTELRPEFFRGRISKAKSISQILGSSPFTERAIPIDFSSEHDILGFKAESLSESDSSQENKQLHNDNTASDDGSLLKDHANVLRESKASLNTNKLLSSGSSVEQDTTDATKKDRKKRSMKLNIIDDNNLIKSIKQDNSAKSLILTVRNGTPRETEAHLQRKTMASTSNPIVDFETLHKALHFAKPCIKMHGNPSNAIDISKPQEVVPEIFITLDKQNEGHVNSQNQNGTKPKETDVLPIIYQTDEDVKSEKDDHDEHSPEQKKNMLQDVDEPTSAIEQYELSTKPYILAAVPKSEDVFASFDVLKGITEYPDSIGIVTNSDNQFAVKESRDMVHGNNKKGFLFIEKRSASAADKLKKQKKENMPTSKKLLRRKRIKFDNYDYDDTVDSLRNKLNAFRQIFNDHDSMPENELIKELSNLKRDTSRSNKNQISNVERNQNNDYYYPDQHEMEHQSSFKGRKLQSFQESESDPIIDSSELNSANTRYGYLDYENGRSNHMKEPGFTKNKIRVKRDLPDLFGMSNDEDYSEDVLGDYNPIKQERSDYMYEEEGDSAVPKKQTYANKKKANQSKMQNVETSEFTTRDTYNSITTEYSIASSSCSQISDISAKTLTGETDNVKILNLDFGKPNVDTDNKIIFLDADPYHMSTDNSVKGFRRDVQCNNCKNSEKSNTKNEKCENCKTSTGTGDCKNCNKKTKIPNKNDPKEPKNNVISTKVEEAEKSAAVPTNLRKLSDREKYWGKRKGSDNLQIRSKKNESSCDQNNAYHSKTASNNTSNDENQKPAKEQANADVVHYKFNSTENKTDPCNDHQTNLSTSNDNINSSIKEKVTTLQEPKGKNAMYTDAKPETINGRKNIQPQPDYRENVGFAHHPLKSKKTHYGNNNNVDNKGILNSKSKVENILTQYHTKYNQNEFNQNIEKPEHEELPELETVADARKGQINIEKLFREQEIYQKLTEYPIVVENNNLKHNIRQKKEIQKVQPQQSEDENNAEFPLDAESNEMEANPRALESLENNPFQNNKDRRYVDLSLQTDNFRSDVTVKTLEKRLGRDKKQIYVESPVPSNILGDIKNGREKKDANNVLLNTVDSFADIVEKQINDKKINKRETNEQKEHDKLSMSSATQERRNRGIHYLEEFNENAIDAPFEKFSKFNKKYWKKHSTRKTKEQPHSHPSYKLPYFHRSEHNSKESPFVSNLNQNSNYANRHSNVLNRRRLRYLGTKNLRRIRRDQFSKFPEGKVGNHMFAENSKRQETKNVDTNVNDRKPRDKGECKTGMKEWISPKVSKTKNNKNSLLAEDKGLNPNFGLKATKGSCNDEAELEKGSKDYGQLHDALNGHLSSVVVQTIFKQMREHQQLKNRFSHGLVRKHGYKSEMKDLDAFRNTETEGDVKHTEEMLHQIMTVLNKIILDQVRRRTCKHLSPELQKFLSSLTKTSKKEVDEEARISEEGFPLPLVKSGKIKEKPVDTEQGDFLFNNPSNKPELEQDEAEIRKKMQMIKELLDRYKNMSSHCKIKVEDVEAYLKKHLCLLKKMLKEIKKEEGSEKKAAKAEGFTPVSKLKRKNYDVSVPFIYSKADLINKQLDSVGLGSGGTYKPPFNLEKLIEDKINKLKFENVRASRLRSLKKNAISSKSNYRNDDDTSDQLGADYDNLKLEHKREIPENKNKNRRPMSEKYRKLVQAAEYFRRKRASEERLGKLFGGTEKRSVKNENYETIKSMNKENQDFSHVGFEKPTVFSLKK